MAEKKPITDERARQFYVYAYAWDMGDTPSPGQERAREIQAREWDAWLAAHDARVRRDARAEALREAARDMGEWADEGIVVVGEDDEDSWAELTVGEWLCARADQIKQGATNG